ncbi:hypothetical protein AB0O86_30405 [Streptomyces hirsutus]|uniref:hypothetical protein n=1 Tax=Streptomyces hirsutus TaxID=35620 RepID=UPI003427E2F7
MEREAGGAGSRNAVTERVLTEPAEQMGHAGTAPGVRAVLNRGGMRVLPRCRPRP